jgi:hypothetical protein
LKFQKLGDVGLAPEDGPSEGLEEGEAILDSDSLGGARRGSEGEGKRFVEEDVM